MMNIQTLSSLVCLASLMACQTGTERQEQAGNKHNESQNQEQKYCFLRTEGMQQQDTSFIQLMVRNETVSGVYNVIPHEKDARRGTVLGKLTDDVFDLVWTFTQEGMQDTLRVVFKQQDGKLLQKQLTVDTLTGRQVTVDSSRFSETYEPVDCAPTSEGDDVDSP
ncbi:hypothetical protein [Parapedobacter pyrenivorans]|uniref:hypothetical protein n=1 Tax=Parapedobacter pyrenivorans TaxID=1305674 RepID=UPI003340D998